MHPSEGNILKAAKQILDLEMSATTKIPPTYHNNDPQSFGFSTARSRWPNILNKVIGDTKAEYEGSTNEKKKIQGEKIVEQVKQLIASILGNKIVEPFKNTSIPGLSSYNKTLKKIGTITWLTGPWLLCECYLYRYLDYLYKSESEWVSFDPFESKKRGAFKASESGVKELCLRYKELSGRLLDPKQRAQFTTEALYNLFVEFIEVSLWGNAIDLSLLANATMEELQSHQGSKAVAEANKRVLCNDIKAAWAGLTEDPPEKRSLDIVLDNAGFEFFTDIVLSLFLLDAKIVSKITFHCKTRPWMVSDTMIKDYALFKKDILGTFPGSQPEIEYLMNHLEAYKKAGKFCLAESEFWTADLDYWHLPSEEDVCGSRKLYEHLRKSSLVIFKGDLNYRKLTADRMWPRNTPFRVGIGSLARSGIKILALRVCKADVCVGLPDGKDEELCKLWKSENHQYGELWCSAGKWAVISYSSGK